MIDIEKVIIALNMHFRKTCKNGDCPYATVGDCEGKLLFDALAILKEQEKEIKALRLLVEWAEECDFGFDQFPYANGYDTGYEKRDDEIVRCKDCEYACICSDDWVICTHIDSNGNDKHPADWFCADGERKKGR